VSGLVNVSRRTFLRGASGALVALPFLPSLLSREAAAQAATAPKRLIVLKSFSTQLVKQWYPAFTGNGYQLNCGVCQYGAANSNDTTGYGGPNAYFTNINASLTQGVVNFMTAIAANGGIDWFALEEPLNAASFSVTSVNGTTPLPTAWVMMLTGLFGGGFLRFLRKQNGTSQVAVA